MNDKALQYSFDLFRQDGYTGTIDEYKDLSDLKKNSWISKNHLGSQKTLGCQKIIWDLTNLDL